MPGWVQQALAPARAIFPIFHSRRRDHPPESEKSVYENGNARGAYAIWCKRFRTQVGQAFVPDPVGQECPTYLSGGHIFTESHVRPRERRRDTVH
jgi:hypothetical protein